MEPWEIDGVPWKTESSYWAWVRGVLRKGWKVHPVKIEFIKKHRKQVPNPNPNGNKPTVWGMTCEICKGDFANSVGKAVKDRVLKDYGVAIVTIEINHKTAASSLRCREDLGVFAHKLLYVTFDDLEPLCKSCHDVVSYSEKHGITFDEAKVHKESIVFSKESIPEQKKVLMEAGFSTKDVSTVKSRRDSYVEMRLGKLRSDA